MSNFHHITIRQGETFVLDGSWPGTNLTGYTARMQVRETHASEVVLLEATTANGRIVLTAAGGFTVTVPASVTGPLAAGVGVYDFEVESAAPGSVVTRLLEGNVRVSPQVTR